MTVPCSLADSSQRCGWVKTHPYITLEEIKPPSAREVSLSKNSCRGEHCSPVPVCLVRKPSRKARCCAKLAGDQWSPLHSLYGKAGVFSTRWASPRGGKLSPKVTDEGRPSRSNPFMGNCGKLAPHPTSLRSATFPRRGRQSVPRWFRTIGGRFYFSITSRQGRFSASSLRR